EDVSGVSGALQGRVESGGMSGTLYSQQTENSLTSLRDILETFDSFIADSLKAEHQIISGNSYSTRYLQQQRLSALLLKSSDVIKN
ncbi:MAG: hypothetical protein K2L34_14475, partial [Muribaculaceae bacterium]|nr:hypothetical protein [Muribaculaceae bacterium]